METLILILCIMVACILLYVFNSKKSEEIIVNQKRNFEIDVKENKIVLAYVEGMPKQYKDNSRLLAGHGKMHFVEAVDGGSEMVRKKDISVLKSIGERFS